MSDCNNVFISLAVWSAVAPFSTFSIALTFAEFNSSIFPVPAPILPRIAFCGIFSTFAKVTASSAILAVSTAPLVSLEAVTVPSLGVPIFTVDPIVMMKKSEPVAGAELNIIELPSIANPSLG